MLQDSNKALEEEIDEHLETTTRLRLSESYINSILRSMPLMLIGLNKQGELPSGTAVPKRSVGWRQTQYWVKISGKPIPVLPSPRHKLKRPRMKIRL